MSYNFKEALDELKYQGIEEAADEFLKLVINKIRNNLIDINNLKKLQFFIFHNNPYILVVYGKLTDGTIVKIIDLELNSFNDITKLFNQIETTLKSQGFKVVEEKMDVPYTRLQSIRGIEILL